MFPIRPFRNKEFVTYFDQLLRVVLTFPSAPAIIILGSWGPLMAHDLGSLTPMWPHIPIAHYYDVPYLSMQPALYDTYLRFPHSVAETFFNTDGFHPTAAGQKLLADLLASYTESVLCELEQEEGYESRGGLLEWKPEETWVGGGPLSMELAKDFNSLVSTKKMPGTSRYAPSIETTAYNFLSLPNATSVPPIPLPNPVSTYIDITKPDPDSWAHLEDAKKLKPQPFCADANDKANPLNPKKNQGWRTMVWKNEKHFWVSDTAGAQLTVDIKVNEGR